MLHSENFDNKRRLLRYTPLYLAWTKWQLIFSFYLNPKWEGGRIVFFRTPARAIIVEGMVYGHASFSPLLLSYCIKLENIETIHYRPSFNPKGGNELTTSIKYCSWTKKITFMHRFFLLPIYTSLSFFFPCTRYNYLN